MASRAPRVLLRLCGCTAKLYVGGLSTRTASGNDAWIFRGPASFAPGTNAAVFRELRVAPCLVEAFCLNWSPVPFDATRRLALLHIPLPVACGQIRSSCGALWQPKLVREPFGTHEWGKDLGCLCDLFQPHGTRTPRSWNCRCSARLPKAAHQSLCQDLQYWASSRPVAALVETKTWFSRLPS